MAEQLTQYLKELFNSDSYIVDLLIVFIVSLLPILELRGGMVAAAVLGIDLWVAFPICVIGNMIPIPFVLLFIRKIFNWLKKTKLFSKLVTKIENRAKKKSKDVEKHKNWGLYIFVAIPLPGTGAWTGALIADILDIRMKKALPVITLGVITAGAIMAVITYVIPYIVSLF